MDSKHDNFGLLLRSKLLIGVKLVLSPETSVQAYQDHKDDDMLADYDVFENLVDIMDTYVPKRARFTTIAKNGRSFTKNHHAKN
jgi:hypothetical protein